MSEQLILWKFLWNCGRMGDLEGIFLATQAQIDVIMGKEVHFGEVLGKHSDISGTMEECDLTKITEDPKDIEVLTRLFKYNTISGHNPVERYYPRCEECWDELSSDEEVERGVCDCCKKDMEE